MNKQSFNKTSNSFDTAFFIVVFNIYNSSLSNADVRSSNIVVGNASYNKVERPMAALNVFFHFIEVTVKFVV